MKRGKCRFPSSGNVRGSGAGNSDDIGFYQLDESLHRCLFDVAGIPGVWQALNVAKAEVDRVRHLKRAFGMGQRELVVEEHTAIVDAIIKRDPARAEQALLDNIGEIDDAIAAISENPTLLRTIEDLNSLASENRRFRGSKRIASK